MSDTTMNDKNISNRKNINKIYFNDNGKVYSYDICEEEENSELNSIESNTISNYMIKREGNIGTIEDKLNKLLWIAIGILVLVILMIVLFWSLLFTCYFCIDLYNNYMKEGFLIGDIDNNNNMSSEKKFELPECKNYN